ncbi:hypothetical protein CHLNCDRAFT_141895 [Chlorella variabilis]|uniref:Photosynthesis system II assembly factor Ycf48/Hcf136-like domain-containing protein n=1 Tax=Chlorella variabilis TaxID=554065 RepID=E1Z7A4_CHLVA|nr:hypothetical protein CHLNCDRAFT_141895 [Chlorella variabilis]EFN57883.1 hypothetical protein CHLNCDRAFT_141895 [Chlorella variabilis]|eukprot:XP_005849985.1 hypothetical protein CHLNCDRAFT_141895 [Chlorella variabilis]
MPRRPSRVAQPLLLGLALCCLAAPAAAGWTKATINADPSTSNLMSVAWFDDSIGVARTTDAGHTWVNVSVTETEAVYGLRSNLQLWSVAPATPTVGYLGGTSSQLNASGNSCTFMAKTTDAGATWTRLDLRTPKQITKTCYSLVAVDADRAWCAAADGYLIKTDNGGASWTAVNGTETQLPAGSDLRSICARDSGQKLWALGKAVPSDGNRTAGIYSTDSGATWQKLSMPADSAPGLEPRSLSCVSSPMMTVLSCTLASCTLAGTTVYSVAYVSEDGPWVISSPYNASGESFSAVAMRDTGTTTLGIAGDLRRNLYYCAGESCM